VSDFIKLVQTQLKRKGLEWTRQQIKEWLEANSEVSADDVVEVICKQPVKQDSAIVSQQANDLSVPEKRVEEIKTVASQMQIDLPVEAIQQIASSVNYAIASRSEFLQELRGAIKAWAQQVNVKLQQDTEQVFEEIGKEVDEIIAADNQRIIQKSQQFKEDVEESVKSFRSLKQQAITAFRV
jgi:hypothetical protein